ncbi:hypothetical protein BDN70DRAFT_186305 [Pholiota conissans]|uniref:Uncharacterized protein n=1 Tax=Pholiota conissans TaxID=109636 RepID=A0A9P5YV49_9AGAR|nr:hypothetical protein BDN70DRAFT_186305 [Pholiota conissans]
MFSGVLDAGKADRMAYTVCPIFQEERDSYSETSTPTHTHAQLLQTPPQIHHPFQPEAPEPPRLVVVNPTPNLTPHPTPPSTPIVLGGLPRAFGTAPGQWLMPPGPHIPSSSRTTGGQAQQIMQQYHLQQAQLAQLLPPLTLPPPPQRAAMTHVLDGVGYGIGAGYVHVSAAGYANGAGSLHAAGHVSPSAMGDRTEKSAAFAGTAGTAAVAGPSTQAQVASGVAGMAYPLATAQSSHAARGQRHEDAHRSLSPPYIQYQQQIQPHSPHSNSQHQHDRQDALASNQTQHGLYSQVPAGGYSHAIAAHGRAAIADAEGLVPAQADLLLRFGGSVSGSGADDVEGVHLLGLLPPLPAPSANTHSYANASGREHTTMSWTPNPNPSTPAPTNTTSGIGNVNGSRDNVNRRSISSASSQATTASLQSTRSHATDSSSATSASARSKATAGEGFEAVLGDDRSDATFGGLSGEVQVNLGMDVDGEEGQTVDVTDDNDVALEEEEDDPLSPLPTVTHFDASISPRTNDKTTTSRSRKRHSAPPRSTSDSSQMRIALSLSPVSPVPHGDVDVEPAVADLPSEQRDKAGVSATQPALRAAVRSRSASSTRSAGKRSSFSAAASKASRKGNMGPPPPPATTISNAASSTTIVAVVTKGAVTTKATSSTAMHRTSSTRSTSRTRSTAGSSLGKSRSRSREASLGLAGLALGMTTAQAVAATVAAAVPSTRSTKPAARGRAKFSLGRAGNKKSAAAQAIRRNSSGIINKAKAKQKEDDEEEEEEAEEEEAEEAKEAEREEEEVEPEEEHFGRDLRSHEDDLDEMDVEVAEAQAETLRVEREARERERLHLQEQARRAAAAEAEKERRREAERRQRQLETIAALTSTATGDNVSETSGKRPVRFNIGSNSDDGMGGRSGGSGSEVSGGVSGQSVGPDPRMGGARRKGKDKELSLEQRLAAQQQEYQRQQQQYQQYQQPHYMPLHRQLSKPQLHQLQIMEQIHQQQQRPTTAQQQERQYQQQFQDQKLASQQSKQFNEQVVAVVENNATSKKGKQRETAVPLPAEPLAKPKKSNSKAQVAPADGGVVDAMLAAKIQDSLNTPLLPTGKKRVELVSTESEFETTDDEGEWSSAEMTADDAEVVC